VRLRLLDAGEALFAEAGFVATSVRDLTARAACNVAAISYYFGSKENLYVEVFRRQLVALRDRRVAGLRKGLETAGESPTLEGVLAAFAEAFLAPFSEQPDGPRVSRLISWELVDPRLPAGAFVEIVLDPVLAAFVEALRLTGTPLPETVARRCLHSVIGQLSHAVLVRRCLGEAQRDAAASFTDREVTEHVVRFSAAGIRALARPNRGAAE